MAKRSLKRKKQDMARDGEVGPPQGAPMTREAALSSLPALDDPLGSRLLVSSVMRGKPGPGLVRQLDPQASLTKPTGRLIQPEWDKPVSQQIGESMIMQGLMGPALQGVSMAAQGLRGGAGVIAPQARPMGGGMASELPPSLPNPTAPPTTGPAPLRFIRGTPEIPPPSMGGASMAPAAKPPGLVAPPTPVDIPPQISTQRLQEMIQEIIAKRPQGGLVAPSLPSGPSIPPMRSWGVPEAGPQLRSSTQAPYPIADSFSLANTGGVQAKPPMIQAPTSAPHSVPPGAETMSMRRPEFTAPPRVGPQNFGAPYDTLVQPQPLAMPQGELPMSMPGLEAPPIPQSVPRLPPSLTPMPELPPSPYFNPSGPGAPYDTLVMPQPLGPSPMMTPNSAVPGSSNWFNNLSPDEQLMFLLQNGGET